MYSSIEDSAVLSNLNPAQLEAVCSVEGPNLIIAGAGSGKTRVLTHKIAYLIEIGIPPQNILALTFTNKAAYVMKERIASLVNPEASKRIWAGTFHSIFARILRFEANSLGFTPNFSIYDAEDSLNIIKKLLSENNISNNRISAESVQHIISKAKNSVLSPEEFAKEAKNSIERQVAYFYKEYQEYVRKNNAMDFDDLLVNTFELFQLYPEILEKYQNRFTFILVDEYQDTNRVQYFIIKQLSSKHQNITVVGDDAQSIYRWRGADIRNILDFQKDFPNAKIFRLEQNYRSTKNILGAADSLIRHNRKQIEKKLWTENEEGDLIELITCQDEKDEASKVVQKIKELVKVDKFTYKDIAIFYRTNAQSLEFENALRKENISYVVVGGMSFYKRKEIKDVLAYLRVMVNPYDDEALIRIINEPNRGIGKATLNHLLTYANEKRISLFESFNFLDEIVNLQQKAKVVISNFQNWIKSFQEKLETRFNLFDVILEYINQSGLIQMYEEINTEDSYDRIDNIKTLLGDIYNFLKLNPELGLEDYLQQISLISDVDDKNFSTEQIKLMTLHSAKGLEFPVVFIVGLEQGLFPLVRYKTTNEDEEEERRLFYVGLTRAMNKLFLTYAKVRYRFGTENYQIPSKFLNEIDPKYIREIKPEKVSSWTYQKSSEYEDLHSYHESYDQTVEETLRVGDKVLHPFFGLGRVEKLEGSGNYAQALVNFENVGRKKLMLQYARLKKV
ncbi:MAG: UvrD-helicase domain-containing protein [Ignavibacteria bacterium]|nr:UvrD-helicase domain-containing protein [Ignavibacteria bacterium]